MLVYFVEDDSSIAYVISKTLEKMNLESEAFATGQDFKTSFEDRKPDLILLDIMLPDTTGLELIKYIRQTNQTIPIIVISALFDEMDKVKALDLGADDYITKPFGILELTSRIQAKLRLVNKKEYLEYGDLKIDLENFRVFASGDSIRFTNKEFLILSFLVKESEKVLTKELIFKEVWQTDFMGETRALDVHIKAIRKKLESINSNVIINTIYGVGYKIGVRE